MDPPYLSKRAIHPIQTIGAPVLLHQKMHRHLSLYLLPCRYASIVPVEQMQK